MLFDNYLSYEIKVYIALIASSIWIYYRTLGCYSALPRGSILSIIFVNIGMYFNYYEPLTAPVSLTLLYLYSLINDKVEL